jgi:hypothetical protein
MKVELELELKKYETEKLRKLIGIQTNTKPDIVVKSLIKMLLNDPDQLEILQYEKPVKKAVFLLPSLYRYDTFNFPFRG